MPTTLDDVLEFLDSANDLILFDEEREYEGDDFVTIRRSVGVSFKDGRHFLVNGEWDGDPYSDVSNFDIEDGCAVSQEEWDKAIEGGLPAYDEVMATGLSDGRESPDSDWDDVRHALGCKPFKSLESQEASADEKVPPSMAGIKNSDPIDPDFDFGI